MSTANLFTGDLHRDWQTLCNLWKQCGRVLGPEVGPLWEMPREHKACIFFAERYPESRQFLMERLSDPDPLIAAHAFKCLIRVVDIKPADIPEPVRSRIEPIESVLHSTVKQKTLGEYVAEYFEAYPSRDELLKAQQRSIDWQLNELAAYKKAKAQELR
ncbi:MAG: hypothetical protein JWQ71_4834 [Pedosphaera sp.]|nr:hypothetical protein [Pedosphaera sp.]